MRRGLVEPIAGNVRTGAFAFLGEELAEPIGSLPSPLGKRRRKMRFKLNPNIPNIPFVAATQTEVTPCRWRNERPTLDMEASARRFL